MVRDRAGRVAPRQLQRSETVVDSPIIIIDLELPVTSWKQLPGRYEFSPPHEGGSFYVSHGHNPVDLLSLEIRHVKDERFAVELELYVDFEGAGYRNEKLTISTEATYGGFSFLVPKWTSPELVTFPAEWHVPSAKEAWAPC
jgi:hypothetical protein